MSRDFLDHPADPRIAAELEELRREIAALDVLASATARRATDLARLLASFEANFTNEPTPQPIVQLVVAVDVIPGLDRDFLDPPPEPVRH